MGVGLALHGGAVALLGLDLRLQEDFLRRTAARGRDLLLAGCSAFECVETLVVDLEDSGLYSAGKGSSPNAFGVFELDACIMDGSTRTVGSVANLAGYKNPIAVARQVAEQTHHCLLVSEGANAFAGSTGAIRVAQPSQYFVPILDPTQYAGPLAHGTVGAACLDIRGNLAAGTSTGGVLNKLPGRVGDTPLAGAGTWADDRIAISCTGQGEYFIRAGAARALSMRYGKLGQRLEEAAMDTINEIREMGGEGGLVCVSLTGEAQVFWNSAGMKAAWLDSQLEVQSTIYDLARKARNSSF